MFRLSLTPFLGGGFKYFFIFTPILGEDEPNLTSIFFGWVGSTTNQLWIEGSPTIEPSKSIFLGLVSGGNFCQVLALEEGRNGVHSRRSGPDLIDLLKGHEP